MKKLMILMFALTPAAALAGDDRPVSFDRLPAAAQKLIRDHFPDSRVSLATVDREILDTSWDVIFTDGSSIEFDSRGDWKEIECRGEARVPAGVMPAAMVDFMGEQFPGARVRDIERDRRGFEVNLDNWRELRFDHHGNFLGYDD
jgi:hypothetical protein